MFHWALLQTVQFEESIYKQRERERERERESLLALLVRERLSNGVVLIWSCILRNVHQMLL
jgi:hypothetical protein